MTKTIHYLLFVGAPRAIGEKLLEIQKRRNEISLIAPTAPQGHHGLTPTSLGIALRALVHKLAASGDHSEAARFSVWTYDNAREEIEAQLDSQLGEAAWIEMVPYKHLSNPVGTFLHVEKRLNEILPLIHQVSNEVFNQRRRSALPIPTKNFRSKLLPLEKRWYKDQSFEELKKSIQKLDNRFRQAHWQKSGAHFSDSKLLFQPAGTELCHGMPHPTGASPECFIKGKFRFGASLYPGFHYDVRSPDGTLDCMLTDCHGEVRNLKPENREYINIFPNDYLSPKKAEQGAC